MIRGLQVRARWEEGVVGEDLEDESQRERFLGVDVRSPGDQRKGGLVTDLPRERPALFPDLGQQPDPPEGGDEPRPLGRQDDVAVEGEGETDTGGCAVDRGDEGGVAAGDEPRDATELVASPPPDVGGASRCSVHQRVCDVGHELQVAAGREPRVSAR